MAQSMTLPEVLTIEEAASYLRLPKETIEEEAAYGKIPGRRIKDTWRFLKAAIDNWLQGYNNSNKSEEKPTRRQVSKEELAAAAQLMLADYTHDTELTAFTALDGEDFYVQE